jgi:hypothetical protein
LPGLFLPRSARRHVADKPPAALYRPETCWSHRVSTVVLSLATPPESVSLRDPQRLCHPPRGHVGTVPGGTGPRLFTRARSVARTHPDFPSFRPGIAGPQIRWHSLGTGAAATTRAESAVTCLAWNRSRCAVGLPIDALSVTDLNSVPRHSRAVPDERLGFGFPILQKACAAKVIQVLLESPLPNLFDPQLPTNGPRQLVRHFDMARDVRPLAVDRVVNPCMLRPFPLKLATLLLEVTDQLLPLHASFRLLP